MNSKISAAIILAVSVMTPQFADARKKGYRLDTGKQTETAAEEQEMARGSFMVASQCTDCNNGYKLSQIAFSGYDKPRTSRTESFFITNDTDRTMTGITMYVEYLTTDGRQLYKRFVRLVCDIPPGQTRKADLESWDRQKSFYYEKSDVPRRGGTPYSVIFDPVSFYLRF